MKLLNSTATDETTTVNFISVSSELPTPQHQ